MKGEEVPDRQWWHANPAKPMPAREPEPVTTPATAATPVLDRPRVRLVIRRRRVKHDRPPSKTR
jgi:hypothetical protein